MKKLLRFAAIALVTMAYQVAVVAVYVGTNAPALHASPPPAGHWVAGEVLVQFHDRNITQTQALASLQSVHALTASPISAGLFRVTVDKNTDIPKLAKEIGKLPGVDFAQPNFTYSIN